MDRSDFFRNRCDELEEIVKCPVCRERLEAPVPLCQEGHHLCMKCKPLFPSCPTCDASFDGTRSYLAEDILAKFEELKITLTVLDQRICEQYRENQISVGTQSPEIVNKNANEESPPTSPANQSKQIGKEAGFSVEGRGKFPCRIGNCTDEIPYVRMANHIRYLHEGFLIDVGNVQEKEYTNSWRIPYQPNNSFDRAIHIYNMGIFFVKIVTNEEGDVIGYVQITNSRQNAQYVQYKLEVGNKNNFTSFEGKVLGSRLDLQKHPKKCLSIHNLYVHHLLQKKKSFECTLKLTLLTELPSNNQESSKRNSSITNNRLSL